jgi:hypothetical protein
MLIAADLSRHLDPVLFAADAGLVLDPWQADLVRQQPRRAILNCSRQSGKSTTVAVLALHVACFEPDSLVVIASPSQRQSAELLRSIRGLHSKLENVPEMDAESVLKIELAIDLDQLRDTESSGLLASLVAQRARLAGYGELAAELGDIAAATRVEGAILANLQTVGKLLQQFVHVHDVRHSSILISPDYLALRQCLVTTLRAFPDAAIAVGRALHKYAP